MSEIQNEVLQSEQSQAEASRINLPASGQSRLDPAWKGARALVVGLGESGFAMAKWLATCEAQVTVLDSRAEPPRRADLQATLPQVRFVHSSFSDFKLEGFDFLAWSPGLSIELGESAALYAAAKAQGMKVLGELDLFLSALESQREVGYQPKLIAVTGTNGKTTVTALTAHLCKAAGLHAQAAGNIGPAMLDAWMEAATGQGQDSTRGELRSMPQVWVLELSSFQIAASQIRIDQKIFDAATVLNLSQDHLDWHESMASYQSAKLKLLMVTKVQVVGDDAALMYKEIIPEPVKVTRASAARLGPPKLVEADEEASTSVRIPAQIDPAPISSVVRFLSGPPASIGDFGLVQDGSLKWLAAGTPGEEIPTRRKGVQTELIIKRLMPADALKIRGQHNHLNVLAALALCRAINLPLSALLHGLRDYRGEPHRCELVAIVSDVEYIDDSKGTNVGATVAGLLGLAKPCHLILGGEGKGQDFSPLLDPVRKYGKSLLMIGRDAKLIASALEASGVETVFCESLAQALDEGASRAKTGEAVLLSPACASYDMFRSYVHRGLVFKELVNQLAQAQGQLVEVTHGADL